MAVVGLADALRSGRERYDRRVPALASTPAGVLGSRPLGRRCVTAGGVAFAAMPTRAPRFFDAALAIVAAAALITEGSLRATGGLPPEAYALAIASAAPLAWRTRAQLAALVGVEAGAVACVVAFDAGWAATAIVIVEVYTVALRGNRLRSLVVGGVTGIGVIVTIVLIEGSLELTAIGLRLLLVFAALAVGDTIRSRQALNAAAREREVRQARERADETRRQAGCQRLSAQGRRARRPDPRNPGRGRRRRTTGAQRDAPVDRRLRHHGAA